MSSVGSDAPRHVGRIVDPDVREDGGLEPRVESGVELDTGSQAADGEARPSSEAPASVQATELSLEGVASNAPAPPAEPDRVPGAEAQRATALEGEIGIVGVASPTSETRPAPAASRASERRTAAVAAPTNEGRTSVAPPASARDRLVDFEGLVDDDPPRRSREFELDRVGDGLLGRPRGGASPTPPRSPMSPLMVSAFGAFLGVLTVATIIAIAMRIDRPSAPATPVASVAPSVGHETKPVAEKPPEPKHRQREKVPGPYRVKDSISDPQLKVVDGQIGFEPFLKAVEKAGVPLKEAYRLLIAFEKVRPLSNCSRHDKFVAALDRSSKRIKAFEYITGPEDVFQAKEGEGGLLVAEKLDLKVKRERVTGAFVVGNAGLERSVTDSAFEPQLLRAMREALIGHLSLEEIERGSRVRVVAQEVTALGEFARYAGIEALEIQFFSEKKRLRVYFFNGPKSRGYFDETARAPYEGGWRSPIPNAPVTSKFNMHRMHPILHKVMPHTGVDFGAGIGVPIGACSFGTITFLGWGGPTGNFIRIEHSGGVETGYAHMSRFAEGLKVGDKVKRLQTIGYVGSTGRSTGPHLHFTVKRDGKFVDPLSLNLDALRVLPSDEREQFLQQKAQYDAQLDSIELPALPSEVERAPASAEPSSEGFEEEGAETESSAAPAGQAPAPSGAPSAATPSNKGSSSLYLTDEELLRMQKSSDTGEVEQ